MEFLNNRKCEPKSEHKAAFQFSERVMEALYSREKSERRQTLVNITQFFDVILPLEFTHRPWYTKFWIRMLERHPYIAYLAPAEGRENYTAKKWMCMSFELLNVMFVDAIFAPIAAPDSGVCDKYTTATECLKPASIDLIDPLCSWNSEEKLCEFREIDQNMGVIILSVLIIKLFEYPLMALCEYLIDQVGNNNIQTPVVEGKNKAHEVSPGSMASPRHKVIPVAAKVQRVGISGDIENSKVVPYVNVDRQILYRLAARVRNFQRRIDEATIGEEVDYLLTHADLYVKSDVIEDLRWSLIVKTSLKDRKNRDRLLSKVQRARVMSRTVLKEMEEKESRDEKEIYLVKRFIVELLSGVHRWVAEQFFFDEVESEISILYRVICTALLILLIVGELTFIFLTGVGMGANATRLWLICLAIVVMQGMLEFHSNIFLFLLT